MHRVDALRAGVLLFVALPAFPALAGRPLELQSANIGAALQDETLDPSGWFFDVGIEGTSDISAASVTVPLAMGQTDPTVLHLECGASPGGVGVECSIRDVDSGPFATLGYLLATYPAGSYVLALNGGVRKASLAFDPSEPDGRVSITSPEEGQTGVSATPTVTYTNSCTNCSDLSFALFELSPNDEIDLRFETADLSSPGAIFYPDWGGDPKPQQLPNGPYAVLGTAAVLESSVESFDDGRGAFDYETGALQGTLVSFSVPEPAGGLAALTALGALGALAARRHGGGGFGHAAPALAVPPLGIGGVGVGRVP